ncbi:MAG: hypothetical protein BWY66_00451 [bacterium ADurb.Bin374]|nr:MAG: hypothetical protein BWY66_00451 [bacterium ADurb.Bin374]
MNRSAPREATDPVRRGTTVCYDSARGFTLVEIMVAILVFGLVSLVVFRFTRWMNDAQSLTAWKQSAQDSLRLNEMFWQKHFTGATRKLSSLVVDSQGVIQTPPDIATAPVKIRNGGNGNLMSGYPNTFSEWPVWQFKTFHKQTGANTWDEFDVVGFLQTRDGNTTLTGRVKSGMKIISEVKLMEHVVSIQASTREFKEENLTVLTVEFILAHPRKPDVRLQKTSNFKISTSLETF